MLEVTRKETYLGKIEHEGELVDHYRQDWIYDDRPIHINVHQRDYLVRAKDIAIYIDIPSDDPELVPRYKVFSAHGYQIDSVTRITNGDHFLAEEVVTDVTVFQIDETLPQLDLFGISIEGADIPLRDYLESKKAEKANA